MKILESTFVEAPEIPDTVLDPAGGEIEFPFPILSWKARSVHAGAMVDPTGHNPDCVSIKVPYAAPYQLTSGLWVLDSVSYRANNVLRATETKDPVILQRSVDKYREEIVTRLCGKDGMLARYILSRRCSGSARFVIVPGDPWIGPNCVGVPEALARRAGIRERDLVLLSRSPVLWQGSVLLMRAKLVSGLAGRLNPSCLKGLGADFDGDTVSVIKWPEALDIGLIEPILGPEEPSVPLEIALGTGPWTLGPEDLLYPKTSDFLKAFQDIKDLPPDMMDYVHGLNMEEFATRTEEIALDMGRMKMHLGIVGSVTDKICTLVPDELLPDALRAKEKLTQALLDSKHGEREMFSATELSEAFEHEQDAGQASWVMTNVLEKAGVERAKEIVSSLIQKGVPPLTQAFRAHRPDLAVTKGAAGPAEIARVLEVVYGHD